MKKLLVVGKSSYVGAKLIEWMKKKYGNEITITSIGTRDGEWKQFNFCKYDVVIHVSGLAHVQENLQTKDKYYEVNCVLTEEVAKKAKKSGVKQFVFLSSMSVYGVKSGIINNDTPLTPKTYYGDSKLKAEISLKKLENEKFLVAIIRPPMIYGMGCKGNFQKLRLFSLRSPFYPDFYNKRSMIFIDNLSTFIDDIIINSRRGVYCPQDKAYVETRNMIRLVSHFNGHNIIPISIFNPLIKYFTKQNFVGKILGDLVYDQDAFLIEKNISENYLDFKEAIKLTEGKN